MRKTFKTLNSLMGREYSSSSIRELIVNGESIVEDKVMADSFNDLFCSVGNDLESALPPVSQTNFRGASSIQSSFFVFRVNYNEIDKLVRGLKNTRNHIDVIPVKLFKSVRAHILKPLVCLINLSFASGT